MSDNYLHLIPTTPNYTPSAEQIQRAISLMSSIWPDVFPEVVARDEVEFIDPGANLAAIYCPRCNSDLDMGWWGEAMDRAAATGFRDLSIETPCCGYPTTLNDLRYYWPVGFAKFSISFRNPGRDFDSATIQRVAEALGAELRKVWAHY